MYFPRQTSYNLATMASDLLKHKPTDQDLDAAWDQAYGRLRAKYPGRPVPSDEHTLLQFHIATRSMHLDPKLTYFHLALDKYYFLYVLRGDELIMNPAIDPIFYAGIKYVADELAKALVDRGVPNNERYPMFASIEEINRQLFKSVIDHVSVMVRRSPDRGLLFDTTMKAAFMQAWNDRVYFVEENGPSLFGSIMEAPPPNDPTDPHIFLCL